MQIESAVKFEPTAASTIPKPRPPEALDIQQLNSAQLAGVAEQHGLKDDVIE